VQLSSAPHRNSRKIGQVINQEKVDISKNTKLKGRRKNRPQSEIVDPCPTIGEEFQWWRVGHVQGGSGGGKLHGCNESL